MEMVEDRGFFISDEERNLTDLETVSLFFFDEDFNEISESEGGVNIQQLINSFRRSDFDAGFFEFYKNEDNQSLVVYVAPPPTGTKGISMEEAKLLNSIFKILRPTQCIIVSSNEYIEKVFVEDNPWTQFSFFLEEELRFNPAHHSYQVKYMRDIPEGRKTRFTKRVDSDIVLRYFGYKAGDVLLELSGDQGYDNSLINDEVFYTLVVADRK